MKLKDCSVTLVVNMGTGIAPTYKDEEILKQILEAAGVDYYRSWEYSIGFVEALENEGVSVKMIPQFYLKVVGGFGTSFVVTNISELFKECFNNNIEINI